MTVYFYLNVAALLAALVMVGEWAVAWARHRPPSRVVDLAFAALLAVLVVYFVIHTLGVAP